MRKARVVSSLAASSPSPQHTHTRTARKTFTTFAANTEAKLSSRSLTLFVSRSVAVLGLRLSCERPLASQHSNLRIQRYDQTRHKLRVGSFRFNGFNSQFNELRRHYSQSTVVPAVVPQLCLAAAHTLPRRTGPCPEPLPTTTHGVRGSDLVPKQQQKEEWLRRSASVRASPRRARRPFFNARGPLARGGPAVGRSGGGRR